MLQEMQSRDAMKLNLGLLDLKFMLIKLCDFVVIGLLETMCTWLLIEMYEIGFD